MAPIIQLDHLLRAWVVAHRVAPLNGVMLALSAIGRGGTVFVAIALALTIARRRARDFVQVGLAIACASILSDSILKPIVERPRPFVTMPQATVLGARPEGASFPSGHSTNAFAGAVTLTALAPAAAPAWWTLAAAIAYSRVYVGVHYPGDVVAGALLGAAVGLLVATAMSRWWRRGPARRT